MPIRSRKENLELATIGQIRKGMPKTAGGIGKDLESKMRVVFAPANSPTANEFTRAHGGCIVDEVRVTLPFNSIDSVWQNWLEAYTAGRMIARSDGLRFEYLVDNQTGKRIVVNGHTFVEDQGWTGPELPYTDGQIVGTQRNGAPIYMKEVGRLNVILPEMDRLAMMTVQTTSKYDCAHLTAQLHGLADMTMRSMGQAIIAGIPMILRRELKDVTWVHKDTNQATRVGKWLLNLEPDPEWVRSMMTVQRGLADPSRNILQLSSGEAIVAHRDDVPVELDNDEEEAGQAPSAQDLEPEPEPEPQRTSPPILAEELRQEKLAQNANPAQPSPAGKRIEELPGYKTSKPRYEAQAALEEATAAVMKAITSQSSKTPPNPRQMSLMAPAIGNIFATDDAEYIRENVLAQITGATQVENAEPGLVTGLFRWLRITNDVGGLPYCANQEAARQLADLWKKLDAALKEQANNNPIPQQDGETIHEGSFE